MRTARHLRLIVVLGLVLCSPPGAAGQEIRESVDVRVVNVDVVATDSSGAVIPGLEREDFRLLVNGKEVAIEYFSAFESVEASLPGAADPADGGLPLLIIDYDGRSSRPGAGRPALEALGGSLKELLESTRAMMVARQGMSLVVEQPFTRDVELLSAAFERLAEMQVPKLSSSGRRLLVSRLENAVDPQLSGFTAEDEDVLDIARELLRDVRVQAEIERHGQREAIAQLESLIASLAGLPGRKAILYLGPGFEPRPAEALYRLWWSKFSSVAEGLRIGSIESEMGLDPTMSRLTKLLEKANRAQVAFYGFDPRGVRVQSTVEFASISASEFSENDLRAAQEWVLSLSLATGGVGRINSTDLDGLLEEMMDGFRNYYSLGFSPAEDFPEAGGVRVKLVGREGRVRHFDRFVTRTGQRGLEELTLAALLTEMAVNPMEIRVEVEPPVRQQDNTYLVPLMVKIPIASLTLVPEGARHVGRLTVVVQAQDAGGELSDPAQGVVPVEIDNGELLKLLSGMAGYRLQMRVSGGEQRIAIGVRDEVARLDSALRLVIHAGRDASKPLSK